MRVALAAALFAEPDILLLDEPTNYLDLEGTLWLEDHIARYPRTVIVISHDRDLLDSAVDSILHLDRGKLTFYRGNYTSFERQRNERLALDLGLAKKQDAQRKRLTAFVERFRAKATKARQAQSRLKLLAKLQPIDVRIEDNVREITIPSPDKPLSPPIIALDDTDVGYEPGRPVLRRLSLRVDADDRIALLGANGNGKSTLTKLLTGRLAPFSGSVTRADKIRIAYFAQHQLDELNPAASAYDHVRKLMPDAPEAKVRARAGAIGFSAGMADTPVANLSGGEKARLLLGLATFEGPHLVVLDEPTNHLDIDSRAALIEAINDYSGAVILVSHDRYLLEACADRLWLVADGEVRPFDGDLDDYRRVVLGTGGGNGEDRATKDETRPSRADQRRAAAEKRAELAPLKRRIDGFDKTIARLAQAHRRDRRHARRSQALRPRPRPRRHARQGTRRRRERARARRGRVARAQRRIRGRRGGLGRDRFNTQEDTMNEEALNISVRKFLKTLGVTAQREIETAVREAAASGRLKDSRSSAGESRRHGRRDRPRVRDRRRYRAGVKRRRRQLNPSGSICSLNF